MSPTRRRAQAGVTLVEMLIATVLLAFILLAIAPLFIASVKSNYSANEYTSIHNIARDRLEQLMSLPFNDPQLAGNYLGPLRINDLPTNLPDPLTGLPSATTPRNPLTITYIVQLFNNPNPAPPTGGKWILVWTGSDTGAYDIKQVDVIVTSGAGPLGPMTKLGIGSRTARVSGFIRNLTPGFPDP